MGILTKKQLKDVAKAYICGGIAGVQVSDVAQTALAYRAILERLEWHNRHSQGESYCPVCFYHKSHGHANDCEVAALLKESEVEGG